MNDAPNVQMVLYLKNINHRLFNMHAADIIQTYICNLDTTVNT